MITEEAGKGGPVSPELLVAFSNQDKIKGRTNNAQVPAQRLQQEQQRSLEPSFEQVQTDYVNKNALQWLQNENNHVLHKGTINAPPKFKPPPGYWEHPHQDFHSNNSTPLDAQKLLRQRHSKLRHPILPKKLITVIGPESSGSTFLAKALASAVGADPTKVNNKARTEDGKTDVQHLSLPWGSSCEDNSSDEMSVHVVDALVPRECFRYEFAPSLDPSIAQAAVIMSQELVKVARDGPQTEVEAQVLKQCHEEVFISEHSNSSCGAKCGTGVFNGYALYPKRFSVNITSQIEWYLQRGVDVTVILSTRDRSISARSKEKNHCNIEKLRRREDEVAIELMNEALEKYGAFGSIKRGLVIVSSYEALMSMKDAYLFGLYKQLGINSTYVPSYSDGNEKYVTDANEANTHKNSSTAEHDRSISVQQPKSEAKGMNPKDLILPKTLITVVGQEGSGSTFLSTTLSKAMSADDESSLQHISLPQGCYSERNATTVDALTPELALYPGRFYVNITSHIQWYLARGVDVKVVLVLRDKTISKKEKLRNHYHCRIPPEVADVEDDAAMKTMREAYQKYGDERVMMVSYEGLMQFKQSYLLEIYKSLGIESTYVPDFIDGNRKYVAKDIRHQMHGPALHKKVSAVKDT